LFLLPSGEKVRMRGLAMPVNPSPLPSPHSWGEGIGVFLRAFSPTERGHNCYDIVSKWGAAFSDRIFNPCNSAYAY